MEDLRVKLAESMRRGRQDNAATGSILGATAATMSLKKDRPQRSGGRSKSPLGMNTGGHSTLNQYSSDALLGNGLSYEGGRDDALTLKAGGQLDDVPSWYKALKK